VFAWVQYNYRNEVISIEFTPRALKERMGLEQKLLIRVGNRTLVLSSKTHRRDVESFVRGVQFKKLRDYGHYMVLEFNKGSCALHFDIDGTFESLSIY
jgi:formamidopyrimidine-DNA glycosylase